MACDDVPQTAISQFLSDAVAGSRVELQDWADRNTSGEGCITELELDDGCNGAAIVFGGNLRIRIHARLISPLTNPVFGVVIYDAAGVPISTAQSIHEGLYTGTMSNKVEVEVHFSKLSLYPGRYFVSPWIMDSAREHDIDFPRMCATFDVHPAPGEFGDLKLHQEWGKVLLPSQWKVARAR